MLFVYPRLFQAALYRFYLRPEVFHPDPAAPGRLLPTSMGSRPTCLYDDEKTVVLRWEAGQPIYNPSFIAFITHYHCRPIACLPGRPETKGKIEAPFQYVEKNLLNGRKFRDMEDFRETARWWLSNRSDVHKHDTTGRSPLELFLEEEQAALTALPGHPYDTAEVALQGLPGGRFSGV